MDVHTVDCVFRSLFLAVNLETVWMFRIGMFKRKPFFLPANHAGTRSHLDSPPVFAQNFSDFIRTSRNGLCSCHTVSMSLKGEIGTKEPALYSTGSNRPCFPRLRYLVPVRLLWWILVSSCSLSSEQHWVRIKSFPPLGIFARKSYGSFRIRKLAYK